MNTTPAPRGILTYLDGDITRSAFVCVDHKLGRHRIVCEVTSCEVAEATAHLIGAAPHLLEALLLIVNEPSNELLDTHRQFALDALALVSEEIVS